MKRERERDGGSEKCREWKGDKSKKKKRDTKRWREENGGSGEGIYSGRR